MAEASGAATVRATLSVTSSLPVTVWLSFAGTATLTSDYTRSATNITIIAGGTTGTVTLRAVQDAMDETNETVTVSIGALTNAVPGATAEVAATVIDDDLPPLVTLGFAEASSLVEAYGSVTFVASLSMTSQLPVTVSFAFSGTAAYQDDYACAGSNLVIAPLSPSGTFTVRGAQDAVLEGLESIVVDVGAVQNGTESGVQRLTVPLADDDQHWVGIGGRVTAWTNGAPAGRVRLGVRDEGVYRVTAGEIAAAAGVSTNEALAALAAQGLSLSCQRREVAWATDGESLFFYGVPTTELYAPENVYWLAFGAGVHLAPFDATPDPAAATNAWFMRAESYRAAFLSPWDPRDRRSSVATLTNVLNFGELIQGTSVEPSRAKARVVALPGFCASAATGVTARASLVSYRDFSTPDTHTCQVWLNSVSIGSQSWSGEQAVTFDFPAAPGIATNGLVEIKVRNGLTTQVNDFMLLNAALVYPCEYRARSGALLCTGGGEGTLAAEGFASEHIRVWDVTEPDAPAELAAPVWQGTDGVWRVAFACGDAATRYALFEEGQGYLEPSVSGVSDTDWADLAEMPVCAIVVPPRRWVEGFAEAAQTLADFRNAQGLRTRVIDAEELYNAFSDGLVHPEAFVRFCAAGVTNGPSPTLRYLLFAGHAGSDYKLEVFRLGELAPYPALFPLALFSQVEASQYAALLLPNDHVLGDVTGSAVPEVAVGRFLATNAVELGWSVDKTIRYELTETWKRKAIFTADWQNVGDKYANFVGIASNTALGFATAGWTLKAFYPGPNDSYLHPYWDDDGQSGAHIELLDGSGFFYYVGHSSDTIAGSTTLNRLFDSATFKQADWPFAPVAFLMGCRMGRWTLLDLKEQQQCIAEAGVRNRGSGFVATVSSAGYSTTGDAAVFSYACADQVKAGALRLGDVWLGAFESLGHSFSARSRHISLLGDPALCLHVDQTARGTATAWLLAHGLAGDPYADLSDQDNDAFDTWVEYQAGTCPTQALVRIRAFALPAAGATGLPVCFEAIGGKAYRVLSATNLLAGVWQALPWRPDTGGPWTTAGITVDWPLKTVEVPLDAVAPRRFYKVQALEE
jgi:hypothetical protein